jgi:hypothetical protein
MKLFTVQDGEVKADKTSVTILLAFIAIVPAVAQAILTPLVEKWTDSAESAKMELEERKVATDLYQMALTNPDSSQRKLMVRFLMAANLLEDNDTVANLPPGEMPRWSETSSEENSVESDSAKSSPPTK